MAPRPHAPRRKACQALLPDGTTPCSATFRGWGRYCAPHLEEHARLSGQFKDAAARAERLRAKGELSDKQVRAMAAESVVGRALQRVRAYREALGEERAARVAYLRRFPPPVGTNAERRAARSEGGVRSRPGSPASVQSDGGGEGEAAEAEGERRESSRGSRFAEDERHEQRLAVLEERQAACDVLIEQLERRRAEIAAAVQQRRGGSASSQGDPERQPLLAGGTVRSQTGWLGWAWRVGLFVVLVRLTLVDRVQATLIAAVIFQLVVVPILFLVYTLSRIRI